MPLIELVTHIRAPAAQVFDLARSIDAHVSSAASSGERAIAGRTSGLMELGEMVTWEARHFGVRQRMTVRMVELERPVRFVDEMVSGAFAAMRHEHLFRELNGVTEMMDRFDFRAPLGLLGRLAEGLFLTAHMRAFLIERNAALKQMAESLS